MTRSFSMRRGRTPSGPLAILVATSLRKLKPTTTVCTSYALFACKVGHRSDPGHAKQWSGRPGTEAGQVQADADWAPPIRVVPRTAAAIVATTSVWRNLIFRGLAEAGRVVAKSPKVTTLEVLDVYADLFDDDLDEVADALDRHAAASVVVKP